MIMSTPIKFIYRPAFSKVMVERLCFCGSGHPHQCQCGQETPIDRPEPKKYPGCVKEKCSGPLVRGPYESYPVACECRARDRIACITGNTVSGDT